MKVASHKASPSLLFLLGLLLACLTCGEVSVHGAAARRYPTHGSAGGRSDRSLSVRTKSVEDVSSASKESFVPCEDAGGESADCRDDPSSAAAAEWCTGPGCPEVVTSNIHRAGQISLSRRPRRLLSSVLLFSVVSLCLLLSGIAPTLFSKQKEGETDRRRAGKEAPPFPVQNQIQRFSVATSTEPIEEVSSWSKWVKAAVIATLVATVVIQWHRGQSFDQGSLQSASTAGATRRVPHDGVERIPPGPSTDDDFYFEEDDTDTGRSTKFMKERKSAAVIAVLFLVWNIAVTLTLPQIDIFAEENQEPPLDSIFYVSPVTDATQDPTRVQTEETDTDSQELIRRTRVAATDPKTVPSPPAAEPKTIPSSPATDPKTISSSPATDPKTIPSSPEAEPRTAPSPPVTEPKPVPRPRTNGPKPGKKSQDLKEDVRRLAEMLKHLHGGDMWHVFLKLEGTINKTASRPAIRLAHEYSRESLQETRLCRTAARLARLSTMLVAAKLTSYEQELSAAAHQLATAKVAMARAADFPDVRPKVILPSEKSLRKLERGFLIQKKDLRLASELARHAYALFTRHEAKAILSFLSLEEEALEFRALYLQSRLEALKADLEAVKGLEKHGTENQGPPYGVLTESELSSLRDTAESLIRQAVLKGAFLQEPTIAAGLAFVFSYDAPEPDFLQTSEFLDEVADDVVRLSEAVTKFANRS